MIAKKLLSFEDVAVELRCKAADVRSLVVEERAMPALKVTLVGYREAYDLHEMSIINDDGMVFDFDQHHIGYLRIERCALDRFLDEHPVSEHAAVAPPGWPWGGHTTALLGHLAAAGQQWWSNYAPSDPTTAPTNKIVVAWLKERGVAERSAEIMATLLRADGLSPGPRK